MDLLQRIAYYPSRYLLLATVLDLILELYFCCCCCETILIKFKKKSIKYLNS